jgi:hypothetical protein
VSDNELAAFLAFFAMIGSSVWAIAWAAVRRRAGKEAPPKVLASMDERLGRLEQAVDAIAVEVERISEGQRFTTKLLSDRASEAVKLPAASRQGG